MSGDDSRLGVGFVASTRRAWSERGASIGQPYQQHPVICARRSEEAGALSSCHLWTTKVPRGVINNI
eukprot:4715705-Prymnesium_polylepis.3